MEMQFFLYIFEIEIISNYIYVNDQ